MMGTGSHMNDDQVSGHSEDLNEETRDEYDFSRGVRGKHHPTYRRGHINLVRKRDGTTVAYSSADQTIAPDRPTTM
jgi:hypothetical protein